MATITKPNTFATGQRFIAAKFNANYDVMYNCLNANLDNANFSTVAAIVDTKLATISTYGKVKGEAISNLSLIAATATIIPEINTPIIPSAIEAKGTGVQDLDAGVVAGLSMNSETYDLNDEFGSSIFTAKITGYYLVTCSATFINTQKNADAHWLYIYKNGAAYISQSTYAGGTGDEVEAISHVMKLAVSDTVGMDVMTTDGSDVRGTQSKLNITRLYNA